ncbi:MAG: type II toxin-antitoxin system Phd/YefM family antitoxin [Nitrospirae bacterium]|nr:type II toxin-antitoxin system Phd/YefM family antitoxin [Nitrospirota bacterium]
MIKTINATDAAREFSEILNSVKYKRDSFTVMRGGKPTAAIVPVESIGILRTMSELRLLIKNLPRLGEDSLQFARDINDVCHDQPAMPDSSSWE